ncbi:hypothetical protein PUN28_018919 [Cardiocondyla obscurior]|uniref:Uncharacterized protein n=1 Tax=Cardiocondyla obscurior TaxID=286306 RepID=A0AAW2EDG1_9HYME
MTEWSGREGGEKKNLILTRRKCFLSKCRLVSRAVLADLAVSSKKLGEFGSALENAELLMHLEIKIGKILFLRLRRENRIESKSSRPGMRKTPTATASMTHCPANVCNKRAFPTTVPRRVTRRHSREEKGEVFATAGALISVNITPSVLKSILRISPHLRSALRPKPRALTRPRKRERSVGDRGRGEKRERIQFLGCILKSADLSTATRANIVDG